jgi:hypothetical protein
MVCQFHVIDAIIAIEFLRHSVRHRTGARTLRGTASRR